MHRPLRWLAAKVGVVLSFFELAKWGRMESSAFCRFRCRKQLLAHVPSRAEQQRLMMMFAFGSRPDDLEATAR
jgi:hypothetical protein